MVVVAACAGAAEVTTTTIAPGTTDAPATTTTQATTTTVAASTTTEAAPTTTEAPEPALTEDGGVYTINWDSVTNPFWNPNAGGEADPFFFIHTEPAEDGFFFSLEMYTTGYGALWTGELGDVDIICDEPPPAPNSTGICPHFDPDGPGPIGDLNADFLATGSITINVLDDDSYDIVVNEIIFSDGSSISTFTLTGP